WAVCSPNEIRVYDRLRNQLRGFATNGVEVQAIDLPPPEFDRVEPRDFALAVFDLAVIENAGEVPRGAISTTSADSARVTSRIVQRISGTPEQLAQLLPRYVDFHCDEQGTQWIQRFDIESPGSMMTGLRGSRRWL